MFHPLIIYFSIGMIGVLFTRERYQKEPERINLTRVLFLWPWSLYLLYLEIKDD